MTLTSLFAILPLMLGLFGTQGSQSPPEVRQLVVNEQLIMRIPVHPRPSARAFEWEEREGPKCISTRSIRGAMLSGADHVDFLLIARQRARARFAEDCPALDFYGGFYLKPEEDKICAGRDSVHSRIGGSCRIEDFQHLVPKRRD